MGFGTGFSGYDFDDPCYCRQLSCPVCNINYKLLRQEKILNSYVICIQYDGYEKILVVQPENGTPQEYISRRSYFKWSNEILAEFRPCENGWGWAKKFAALV